MSLKGMSDSGPTTAAADALANDKETPTSPSAGTTSFRRFRGEACFVFGILQSSKPMLRRCRVGFGPACGKAKPRAERCGRTKAKITKQRKSPPPKRGKAVRKGHQQETTEMGAVVNSVRAGECGSSRHLSLRHQRSTTGGGPLVPETIFVPGNRIRRPETTRPKLPGARHRSLRRPER